MIMKLHSDVEYLIISESTYKPRTSSGPSYLEATEVTFCVDFGDSAHCASLSMHLSGVY